MGAEAAEAKDGAAVAEETDVAEDGAVTEETLVARDSLRILPLSMVPLETVPLRRARMIKNVSLESVVEFFRDASTGSGQLLPEQLPEYFGWPPDEIHPDLRTLQSLALLNSYDVYSLRIELRRLGIELRDHSQLSLSDTKSRELAGYMKGFTGPLMQQVFGSSDTEVQDFDQLIDMFKSPNKEEALRNLNMLAEKLQIDLMEVPRFLEDYGDTFLSLAYFKECLDDVVPKVMDFLENIDEMKNSFQLKNTHGFMAAVSYMEPRLNAIITSITGRFESFDQHTEHLWENISAEQFKRVRQLIRTHHSTIGGVLCGLSVKMDAWEERFEKVERSAAIIRKAEFVMGEMRQGLELVEAIEASAPKIAAAHA